MSNTQPIEGIQVPLTKGTTIATNIATIITSLIKWVSISFITLIVVIAITSIILSMIVILKYNPLIKINDNGIELFKGSITIKKSDTNSYDMQIKDANGSLTITDGSITIQDKHGSISITEEVKNNDIKEE